MVQAGPELSLCWYPSLGPLSNPLNQKTNATRAGISHGLGAILILSNSLSRIERYFDLWPFVLGISAHFCIQRGPCSFSNVSLSLSCLDDLQLYRGELLQSSRSQPICLNQIVTLLCVITLYDSNACVGWSCLSYFRFRSEWEPVFQQPEWYCRSGELPDPCLDLGDLDRVTEK